MDLKPYEDLLSSWQGDTGHRTQVAAKAIRELLDELKRHQEFVAAARAIDASRVHDEEKWDELAGIDWPT